MQHAIIILISILFLSSCDDTNVVMMTGAAADAVTAITLSDEDVKTLAQQAAQTSDSRNRVASKGNPYDTRLRKLLSDGSLFDNKTFDVKVYLTQEVNAFAMANGTIRIHSGLMDLMNDQELLFVIGHEMGHVIKEHSRKKVVLAYASSALRKGLASQENEIGQIARSLVGSFAEQLTNAQFSQHEEKGADKHGVYFLQTFGHEKDAAVSALNKLAELAAGKHTFLSSHPNPLARARLIAQDNDSNEQQDSFFDNLWGHTKAIFVFLLSLFRSIVNWILSLL